MSEIELCKEMLIHCTFNARRKDLTSNEVISILSNFFSLKTIREAKELIMNPKPVIKMDDIGTHRYEELLKADWRIPKDNPATHTMYRNEARPIYHGEMLPGFTSPN